MCRVAWLGSNHELPQRLCPAGAANLIMTVVPDDSAWASDCLKTAHVYALGHNSGCACHFGQGGRVEWDQDPHRLSDEELKARAELAEYLRTAVAGGNVHLLTTWDGELEPKPSITELPPNAIAEQAFEFSERPQLVRFTRAV